MAPEPSRWGAPRSEPKSDANTSAGEGRWLARLLVSGFTPEWPSFSNEELIKEAYRGTRPAPGYPACPEHTVKADMFKLLQCDEIGMQVTESFAMFPGASVSGFYFAHPESKYFVVGKIGEDQVVDMTARRGVAREDVERWLAPNL